MRVTFQPRHLLLVPETPADEADLAAWTARSQGHVFYLPPPEPASGGATAALHDIGPQADACREPINVRFESGDLRWQLISNLAHTPFILHGHRYASVEAFWQGLKLRSTRDRRRVAALWGIDAKNAAQDVAERPTFDYGGETIATGRYIHWELLRQACEAKFTQNPDARSVLFATGQRQLTHRTRRDSRTIPGALLAQIWMDIRDRLREEIRLASGAPSPQSSSS